MYLCLFACIFDDHIRYLLKNLSLHIVLSICSSYIVLHIVHIGLPLWLSW